MKPIVIDANNMTFDEIKDAIEEAYQTGLKDGYDKGYTEGKRSMQLTWRGDPVPTNIPASKEYDPWWWMVKPTVTTAGTTADTTMKSRDDDRTYCNSV